MNGFERHQMFSALILLAMALFVASGALLAARRRRAMRIAAVVAFCAATIWALIKIAFWVTEMR